MGNDFRRTVAPPTVDPTGGHMQRLQEVRASGGVATEALQTESTTESRIQREHPDTYKAILERAQALAKQRRQDTEGITLRLSGTILKRLRRHAVEHGYSHNLSALVEALLDVYLPDDDFVKS